MASAPTPKKGVSTPKKSYSPKNRADCNDSAVTVKGQPSGGGLQAVDACDPEKGTTESN